MSDASNHFDIVRAALRTGEGVLLYGPPGTGKSWLATQALGEGGRPLRVTLTEGHLVSDLVATLLPRDGGGWQVAPGPLARALAEGWPIHLDEIDRASGEVMQALLGLLDDRPHVVLPDGRAITADRKPAVIATSNVADPSELEPALLDRLAVRLHVAEPSEQAIASLRAIAEAVAINQEPAGAFAETLVALCADAYAAGAPVLTFRECRAALRLIAEGLEPSPALAAVAGPDRASTLTDAVIAKASEAPRVSAEG